MPISATIKTLEAIVDYDACQEEASSILEQFSQVKRPIFDAFFKKLDLISSSMLRESEKQWLIVVFVHCAINQLDVEEPDVDLFIDSAQRLKKEGSAKRFKLLFQTLCEPEDAKFEYYIGICEQCVLQKETIERSDLKLDHPYWTSQRWGELLDYLRIVNPLKETYPEIGLLGRSIPVNEAVKRFSTVSDVVKFPLSEEDLRSISADYKKIMQFEKGLLDLPKSVFIKLLREHQATFIQDLTNSEHQLKMLALLRHAIRFVNGKYPYITQLFAILGLLQGDLGRIAQVRTGEGKSTIVAVLVAFLACMNKRVFWVTSSKDLAARDFDEAKALFELLGISFACVNDRADRTRHYHERVLVGTNADFEFLCLGDALKKESEAQLSTKKEGERWVAVVDEVDNLLIDVAGHSARLALVSPDQTPWIYPVAIDYVKTLPKDAEVTEVRIDELRLTLELLQAGIYKEKIDKISDRQLGRLFKSAQKACYELQVEHHYDVVEGKIQIVDAGNTGNVQKGMRWGQGTHECVEVIHGLEPREATLTSASISHPSFFNHFFDEIYGLSGTMGSVDERQEIMSVYGLGCFDVPHHVPSQRQVLPGMLLATEALQYEKLLEVTLQKQEANHPILVLFPTIKASKAFYEFLAVRKIKAQLINDRQSVDKDYIIAQAGHPRVITIATNVASRGTDIRLKGQHNPGLFLLVAFYPENDRIEDQMLGRVARQGQPGFCQMILSLGDALIKRLFPHVSMRDTLMQEPDFINILIKARAMQVQLASHDRLLQGTRDQALFPVFLSFSSLYRLCLKAIDGLPTENLASYCKTLKLDYGARDVPPSSFKHMAQRANVGLMQQERGISVDWSLFIAEFKLLYHLYLQQQWASFYTELNLELPSDDLLETPDYKKQLLEQFHLFIQSDMKPYVELPTMGFVSLLFKVLGVSECHASVFLDSEQVDLFAEKREFSRWENDLCRSAIKTLVQIRSNGMGVNVEADRVALGKTLKQELLQQIIQDQLGVRVW